MPGPLIPILGRLLVGLAGRKAAGMAGRAATKKVSRKAPWLRGRKKLEVSKPPPPPQPSQRPIRSAVRSVASKLPVLNRIVKPPQAPGTQQQPQPERPRGMGAMLMRAMGRKGSDDRPQLRGPQKAEWERLAKPMSPAEMLGRGAFSQDAAQEMRSKDRQEFAQEQHGRLEEERAQETEEAIKQLKQFTKGLALGAAGLLLMKKAMDHYRRRREQSIGENFGGIHGGFAAELATNRIQDLQLRRQRAQDTFGTGQAFLQSGREFREAMQPTEELLENIKNTLGTAFNKLATVGAKVVSPISNALNALVAEEQKANGTATPFGRQLAQPRGNQVAGGRGPIPPIP